MRRRWTSAPSPQLWMPSPRRIPCCIAGTSLAVYPAAGLIRYFEGDCLALVNLSPTPMDQKADLLIRGKIGEVLSQIQ